MADENCCLICTEEIDIQWHSFVAKCGHRWCQECLEQRFDLACRQEHSFPPRCCFEITLEDVQFFLPPDLFDRFYQRRQELGTEDRLYCHKPRCQQLLPRTAEKIQCWECGSWTCALCKGEGHEGPCPVVPAEEEFKAAAAEAGYQRCRKCKRMVEKTSGCHHIVCVCHFQFCYNCGLEWKTCACEPDPVGAADLRAHQHLVALLDEQMAFDEQMIHYQMAQEAQFRGPHRPALALPYRLDPDQPLWGNALGLGQPPRVMNLGQPPRDVGFFNEHGILRGMPTRPYRSGRARSVEDEGRAMRQGTGMEAHAQDHRVTMTLPRRSLNPYMDGSSEPRPRPPQIARTQLADLHREGRHPARNITEARTDPGPSHVPHCTHARLRRVDSGPLICDLCAYQLPNFIWRCDGCGRRACTRCRNHVLL